MTSHSPLTSPRLWAPLLAAGLACLGWAAWARARRPLQVLLSVRTSAADGFDPGQRRALRDWVQWQLDAGGCTVIPAEDPAPARLPGRTLLLELTPKRDADQLQLAWRQARAGDLADRGESAWVATRQTAGDPPQALRALMRDLPLPSGATAPESLLPARPATFWRLLDAIAWNRDSSRLPQAYGQALAATQDEPDCALAWMVLGDLHYRRMLLSPQSDPMAQTVAETNFHHALDLAPDTPQMVFLLAQLKVDAGDHASALAELNRGIRAHPRSLALRTGLVYAARTAGLMDLTRHALARVDELVPPGFPPTAAENAWLYLGDRQRFEASLRTAPGEPRATVAAFYRGYLALSDGNGAAAADWFQRCRAGAASYSQFSDLAGVYELIANGDRDGATARLKALSTSRVGLRIPDGEFTFKLAEAHALLGATAAAQDMADKAFAQGFGCTAWYERSPFLAPIRGTARWRALTTHLRERQQLLESAFPPSAFA